MIPVSAATVKRLDALAVSSGIPARSLMENAGGAVAEKVSNILAASNIREITFFCGKGNNGGDGFVAARKLFQAGRKVDLFLAVETCKIKGEALHNYKILKSTGCGITELNTVSALRKVFEGKKPSFVVDALLGTGFTGKLSGLFLAIVETINSWEIPVVSVDIPSGLDSTTGEVNPQAIRARWTVTFALPKKGFYVNAGPSCAGEITVTDIGFPKSLVKDAIEYERRHEKNKI